MPESKESLKAAYDAGYLAGRSDLAYDFDLRLGDDDAYWLDFDQWYEIHCSV